MNNKEPIITSLLDTDYYKFTMGQFVWSMYKDVSVGYAFKCRTQDVRLTDYIDISELRQELNHVRNLQFSVEELDYFSKLSIFREEYIDYLHNLRLPEFILAQNSDGFKLEFHGSWEETIYWETFALSIINELYYRGRIKHLDPIHYDSIMATGILSLKDKIDKLNNVQGGSIAFADFGTRRRFSKFWQDYVVAMLNKSVEYSLTGTSNVALAYKYNLKPIGTMAHELFMIATGLVRSYSTSEEAILLSHDKVMDEWYTIYGYDLSIMLTDTYGNSFFFNTITKERAEKFKGFRHDSGDPFEYGEKILDMYYRLNIDPKQKTIVFSDGLDIDTIIALHKKFSNKINVSFGWGTNLTNDMGLRALSLVVKPITVDGIGTVKLSDNLNKATGDPDDIKLFRKIFGYTGDKYIECKY